MDSIDEKRTRQWSPPRKQWQDRANAGHGRCSVRGRSPVAKLQDLMKDAVMLGFDDEDDKQRAIDDLAKAISAVRTCPCRRLTRDDCRR